MSSKGGNSAKIDRNKKWCTGYLNSGVQARNQLRRVTRHVRQSIRHRDRVNFMRKRIIGYDVSARSWLTAHGKEIKGV